MSQTEQQVETKPKRDPRDNWLSVTRVLKLAGLSPWTEVELDQLRRGVEHGLDERRLRYILSGVYPEVLAAKADVGHNVHQAIADIEHGLTEAWWEDETWTPYVTAYLKFREESHYKATLVEYRVYHESYPYRGDLDSLGMLNGKIEALIDVKTTVAMDPTIAYQLAGYEGCLPANPKRVRLGLQLKYDGDYQVHEYKDRNDHKILLAALTVATIKEGLRS